MTQIGVKQCQKCVELLNDKPSNGSMNKTIGLKIVSVLDLDWVKKKHVNGHVTQYWVSDWVETKPNIVFCLLFPMLGKYHNWVN